MLLNPHVGDALQRLGSAIRFHTELEPRVREACILLVANTLNSDFEKYAHETVGAGVGLTGQELEMLRIAEADSLPFADGSPERLCLELVLRLIRDEQIDEPFYTRCADELGRPCLFELSALVGYYRLLATQLDLFDVRRPDMTSG
ncbi:carboxymuconolactone decarboxylase family protein [Gordonia terrae]|uniref:carboxymuconolactone decarboxylase family protein n=1 Tax=Gordonia terrae TaxID=2055 RepID=UPI003F6C5A42